MSTEINSFNIRIYSLIINNKREVLLSDEFRLGRRMTKFPGGGLQFGESIRECLHREAMEEFGQDIEITGHFYTTDFFMQPFHRSDQQLISIYYLTKFKSEIGFKISTKKFDFPGEADKNQSFRWKSIKNIEADEITFANDRYVANLLKSKKR